MAQGNLYLLIPDNEKENQVPAKLRDKWQFTEAVLDEQGQPTGQTTIVHPSWLGAANRLRKNFGVVRDVTYSGKAFKLIELELSFIDGEVQEVQKLQSNQPGRQQDYQILTNSEAQDLLAGIDIFQNR